LATFDVPEEVFFAVSTDLLTAGLAGAAAFAGAAGAALTGADLDAGRAAGFFTTVAGFAAGAGAALAGVFLMGAALTGAALAGVAFLAGAAFFAGAFAGAAFLATGFLAGAAFLATGFFAMGFLAGAAFFAAGLATGFFAADFFGAAALAAGFLVALTAFFAGFFAATSGVSSVPSNELRGDLRGCRSSLQGPDSQSWGLDREKQCAFRQSLQRDPASGLCCWKARCYTLPRLPRQPHSDCGFSVLEYMAKRAHTCPV
jgi:hypothetical protein